MTMERVTIRAREAHEVGSAWSFQAIWRAVAQELALRRSRLALLKLDDAHLRDIGLTRAMARDEAARSFLTDD